MPTEAADARALLQVAPDDYVAERTRLVKQARADGDRALAGFYQSLKRPSLSLWAVLAAADDADAVHRLVTVTAELAGIQAGGGPAGAVIAATRTRREALETMVDRAVTALARWDSGAPARRGEIRVIVDQLSRHADLAETWIDATLRDLPDDAFGFGAFDDMPVPEPAGADSPEKVHRTRPTAKKTPTARPDEPSSQREAPVPAAERAARAEQARRARQELAGATRTLAAAERRVEVAREAARKAENELRDAEAARAAAEHRHEQAKARVAAGNLEGVDR